jgi:diaminohydroxyphosphoribosylaminopyrimidine deaminase/5-amino-6-(5-phosphoribosylamino)uracil reductase
VHERRAEVDAVLVGAGTVIADDPQLTVRLEASSRQPVRVILDGRGIVPDSARVFEPEGDVIVATTDEAPHEVQTAWKEAGAEVVVLPSSHRGVDLQALLADLGARGMVEVRCEGGAGLATSLLAADLADRLELHYGPVIAGAGGPEIGDVGLATLGEGQRWIVREVARAGDDTLVSLDGPRLGALVQARGGK